MIAASGALSLYSEKGRRVREQAVQKSKEQKKSRADDPSLIACEARAPARSERKARLLSARQGGGGEGSGAGFRLRAVAVYLLDWIKMQACNKGKRRGADPALSRATLM